MKKLFNGLLILLLLAGSTWAADPEYEIGSGSIMSSPPAIGAVAPNTGKFTTLDATGDFKVVGHSSLDSADFVGNVHTSNASTATFDGPVIVNGAFNYTGQVQGTADNINIGQVAPGKGKFTTLEATGGITGTLTGNSSTATALASNPTDCSANNFATAIDASGNLTCAAPSGGTYASGEVSGITCTGASPTFSFAPGFTPTMVFFATANGGANPSFGWDKGTARERMYWSSGSATIDNTQSVTVSSTGNCNGYITTMGATTTVTMTQDASFVGTFKVVWVAFN